MVADSGSATIEVSAFARTALAEASFVVSCDWARGAKTSAAATAVRATLKDFMVFSGYL
jgi:hypothetical protein